MSEQDTNNDLIGGLVIPTQEFIYNATHHFNWEMTIFNALSLPRTFNFSEVNISALISLSFACRTLIYAKSFVNSC